jgi:hypothetical protein
MTSIRKLTNSCWDLQMDHVRPVPFYIPPEPKITQTDVSGGSSIRRLAGKSRFQKLSEEPPHTKFAVIPSRAVTDPRINCRKPLLLLLAALGVHASIHGICYPSQRRLAFLCNKSPSWASKYLNELQRLGYVRRLVPPRYRGPRSAQRLQILWVGNDPLPIKETDWKSVPWCWR